MSVEIPPQMNMNNELLQPCPHCHKLISPNIGRCPKCETILAFNSQLTEADQHKQLNIKYNSLRVFLSITAITFGIIQLVSSFLNFFEVANSYAGQSTLGVMMFAMIDTGAWVLSGLALSMNYIAGLYLGLVLAWMTLFFSIMTLNFVSLILAIAYIIPGRKALKTWHRLQKHSTDL
jgi:hypothetical protein